MSDWEEDAFITVVTFHFRPKGQTDRCAMCGPLPLGSSFPEHQWNEFVKLRSQ